MKPYNLVMEKMKFERRLEDMAKKKELTVEETLLQEITKCPVCEGRGTTRNNTEPEVKFCPRCGGWGDLRLEEKNRTFG